MATNALGRDFSSFDEGSQHRAGDSGEFLQRSLLFWLPLSMVTRANGGNMRLSEYLFLIGACFCLLFWALSQNHDAAYLVGAMLQVNIAIACAYAVKDKE